MSLVFPLVAGGRGMCGEGGAAVVSFGVIADPQYADKEAAGTRYYRESLGKLRAAVGELRKEELDFVVTLGDVIDEGFGSFGEIMPVYGGLEVPHRLVMGNHDFDVADEDKGKVMGAMGLRESYYSEVVRGWRFIYLDGCAGGVFRHVEGSEGWKDAKRILEDAKRRGKPQAHAWNGAIGEVQRAWLKGELDESREAGERVIVCNHFPVWPAGDAHNLLDAEEVVALLDGYEHVAAYFNGHNHRGNYAVRKGTHFVNFKGMVEGEKKTAYAVVRCYGDRVEIDGYGLEPDRVMK